MICYLERESDKIVLNLDCKNLTKIYLISSVMKLSTKFGIKIFL